MPFYERTGFYNTIVRRNTLEIEESNKSLDEFDVVPDGSKSQDEESSGEIPIESD